MTKVSENVNVKINLKRPSKANITIHPRTVDLKLSVDEFTEKVIEIPIKVINNKEYRNVRLLPDKVKLTFLSPLSKYQELDRNDFELIVDLNNWKENGYTQLPVRIIRTPAYTRILKIEPQTLDFIIQK